VALGDFDYDGIADLVTANYFSSTVSVLRGNGDGTFQPAVDFWSGDATTGVAVGDFNDDGRVDVVAGRLRNDHLALLLNDSPQRGDGVVIERDISYGSPTHPTNDPFAAHHTLDVYSPPKGTASFGGRGQPYPVVLFAHGGAGITGDKSQVSLLMRTRAREGIVAVKTNNRLGGARSPDDGETRDVAQAFRWTYDNVGSRNYGGDPNNLFVFGTSQGGTTVGRLGTEPKWLADQQLDYQQHIRGMVVANIVPLTAPTPTQRPLLLMTGTEGLETATGPAAQAFSEASTNLGAESYHKTIAGRDHLTLVSNMALAGDQGRAHLLEFMRTH
jgi:acetyl esterase/lipase